MVDTSMERSTTHWAEFKLNAQPLFRMPMLEIDFQTQTRFNYIRPEWEFGPDYALHQDEEPARSINKYDDKMTQKGNVGLKQEDDTAKDEEAQADPP